MIKIKATESVTRHMALLQHTQSQKWRESVADNANISIIRRFWL